GYHLFHLRWSRDPVLGKLIPRGAIQIRDEDIGAFLGETSRNPLAEPVATTCTSDDDGFTADAPHGASAP
ncbi:hypothetical protein RZS08_56770, partial [Arthrospira platensis SPKY1]|nr:hypothetical protein [Arthrospira platensis SPKY1]